MVLLISGGLLAIGLLAILALIWLIRGASGEQEQESASGVQLRAATPRVEVAPAAEVDGTGAVLSDGQMTSLALMNPEFHALATQLRTLHQQSAELEERLDILIQVVERIERSLPQQTHAEQPEGTE